MKAIDVNRHFLSKADWVDPNQTVDKIIVGDPDREVQRVLVTWISSFEAVRTAAKRGFDMLMTHEPTFWVHAAEREKMEGWEAGLPKKELALAKKRLIEEGGLVILRNHDVWDRMPEIGIPWAWARFLGFGESPFKIGGRGFQHRYDIEPISVDELAKRIAQRTATIGEPVVQVVGDRLLIVSKVGVGTGCACDIYTYQEMGCDISIVCDDGSSYWAGIQYAMDRNHPVIRVNHGTSEEPGMMTLTKYINDTLPLKAEHLPHVCSYRLASARP